MSSYPAGWLQDKLEGAQRVHISAKWIFLQLLYTVGREMVPR